MAWDSKKEMLEAFFADDASVRAGHMFGYPAFYIGRSMFACLFDGQLGLKVPEVVANEARNLADVTDFRPNGKPKMREWIQFSVESKADLENHTELINHAVEYAHLNTQKKKEESHR